MSQRQLQGFNVVSMALEGGCTVREAAQALGVSRQRAVRWNRSGPPRRAESRAGVRSEEEYTVSQSGHDVGGGAVVTATGRKGMGSDDGTEECETGARGGCPLPRVRGCPRGFLVGARTSPAP